jgi:hypothetical protein
VAVRGQHRIWRTISLRGSSLASPSCQRASSSRASVSSPLSSASRMPVKWWLNWRKPSVTYSTSTLQTMAAGQPTNRCSNSWIAKAAIAGATTASDHATQPCCGLPASKLRLTQRAQKRNLPWIAFCGPSGRTCSISRANSSAKKLMAE